MESNSSCLFNSNSGCGGMKISCQYLCKPPVTTDQLSSLLGCKTKLESLILQYGRIDMIPCNVEEFHVCQNHSELPYSSLFKNCCLCKPFGRSKSSKSGLRIVSKLYALAAWKEYQVRFSFGRKMCTQCRNGLEKVTLNEEFKEECDALLQWLYDVNITHTPSKASSDSYHVLSQSFSGLTVKDKQVKLKEFLREIQFFDHAPTTTSFVELQPISKRRFCRQSTEVLQSIIDIMAPNDDTDIVWQSILAYEKRNSFGNDRIDKNLRLILSSFAEAYDNAQHWTVRRQILSIMAKDVDFSTIRMFIPDLSLYRFKMARRHADLVGKGVVVDDTRTPTIRFDDNQLEHFIEFIVSPHICTDLPFGEKELHLSTGEILLIPLTIRNLAPQRIVKQYFNYCKEYCDASFHPLNESTLFSILNGCAASIRRSLSGLDSISAEGSTAFDLFLDNLNSDFFYSPVVPWGQIEYLMCGSSHDM